MPITLNCPKCHKPFRVRDESIGGRVRCPSCGTVLQVPAALSPASHFDEAPKAERPEDSERPLADDVQGKSHAGTAIHEVALGGPAKRDDQVDLGPPAGASLPGPPSIKARVPYQPPTLASSPRPTDRPTAPAQLPTAPSPTRLGRPAAPPRPPSDEEIPWMRVRGGLGMIRLGLFLLALWVLAIFGHGIWIMYDFDRAWSDGPGLLKLPGWPLKLEVFVAYTAGLTIPAALLLLAGRLRCAGAPREANARGLALGAAFFTFVAIAGAAVYLGITYFKLAEKVKLPADQTRLTALFAGIPAAVLADILTLLFIGQIGWPLRRPQFQKSVAGFFIYAAIIPAGVLIGELFYPVVRAAQESMQKVGTIFGGPKEQADRIIIWSAIVIAAVTLLILRYAAIAGRARRAIRKLLAGEA